MNAVVVAVIVMLVLSLSRVHVVLSLTVGAFVGGLVAGMPLENIVDTAGNVTQSGIIPVFNEGLKGGARISLSYAMLGAFAMAITYSGLPQQLAGGIIRKLNNSQDAAKGESSVKWTLLLIILAMGIMSQNVVPIHIAFIPMIIPPLLLVFNRLKVDRRLVACVITFGLVTTYMFLPYGFGAIFLNDILLGNIKSAGMDVKGISVMHAMAIPALGMVAGLLARPELLKVGFGLAGDRAQLLARFGVAPQGLVDLDQTYRALGYRSSLGIRMAMAVTFGRYFEKSKSIGTSDWSRQPLSAAQCRYAAHDAWGAFRIYEALCAQGIDVVPPPVVAKGGVLRRPRSRPRPQPSPLASARSADRRADAG